MTLEDNADVEANLAVKDLPRSEYLNIPIGGGFGRCTTYRLPVEIIM